ncbi:MAG: ABC transporter permease, partial [Candidatus Rokuibacteriota bacterium]
MADRDSDRLKPRSLGAAALREADVGIITGVAVSRVEQSESPMAQALRRLRRSKTALLGLAIVVALLLVAALADVLAPQSPIVSNQTETFRTPSWEHPLGTDQLGRDMLSRVIHGSRISLAVGLASVLMALFVGVPVGMLAGFYGGRVDMLVMRVMDLILAFPIYLLA